MRKPRPGKIALWVLLAYGLNVSAQSASETVQEITYMIDDAIFFTDRYITPATDAIAYQAAAGWMTTPKKANLGEVNIGLNFNTFFVPQGQRQFVLHNADLKFFTIEGMAEGNTPTALGSDQVISLGGTLNGEPVTLESPEGVNRETIFYPYLQGGIGVGYGTEIVGRFAPKIVLKHVDFQIYGIGLKHNLSQYIPKMEAGKWHLAAMALYSREKVTVEFLDVETGYGNLGLNGLQSDVDSWQFQFNGSKEFKRFELSAAVVGNSSSFEYEVQGKRGEIENVIPLHDILNKKLETVYKTKFNMLGEVAARYDIGNSFFLQGYVGFGKFLNTNLSLQYQL